MKNYFVQLTELNVAKARLNTLEEKKKMYLRKATSTTGTIKDIMVTGGKAPNKMDEYVIKCEKINKEIEEVKEEIAVLQKGIDDMDNYLESHKDKTDIERKVFVLYYKDGRKPNEIANILPCGIATVYRKLKIIEKIFKDDNK